MCRRSTELVGRYVAQDLIDEQTGLVFAEAGAELTPELLAKLIEAKVQDLPVLDIDHVTIGPYMRNTLAAERATPRGRAARHLPGPAPGRAAHPGYRREPVPRPVLR